MTKIFAVKDYPLAKIPGKSYRGKNKLCIHCRKNIKVKRWDAWNGFLVKCPHCKKLHGDNWNVKAILWGSFFLHAFSFFFTMRPQKALLLIAVFILIALLGNYTLEREILPQIFETALVILFIFAPIILNGVLIIFHESRLNYSKKSGKEKAYSFLEEVFSFFS